MRREKSAPANITEQFLFTQHTVTLISLYIRSPPPSTYHCTLLTARWLKLENLNVIMLYLSCDIYFGTPSWGAMYQPAVLFTQACVSGVCWSLIEETQSIYIFYKLYLLNGTKDNKKKEKYFFSLRGRKQLKAKELF